MPVRDTSPAAKSTPVQQLQDHNIICGEYTPYCIDKGTLTEVRKNMLARRFGLVGADLVARSACSSTTGRGCCCNSRGTAGRGRCKSSSTAGGARCISSAAGRRRPQQGYGPDRLPMVTE